MDVLRVRDKVQRLSPPLRNAVLTESIAWLESHERLKCKAEHLQYLIQFENELQALLNQPRIPDIWFTTAMQTYGSFPFWDAFIRKTS
jgi:hypothetical protein